jgi:two-component system, LytTR family, sensor kinase
MDGISKFSCENSFKDFLVKKENRIWRHLIFGTLLLIQFSPEIIYIFKSYSEYSLVKANQVAIIEFTTIASAFTLIYVNLFWLVPSFLLKKKYPFYFSLTAVELILDFSITLYLSFVLTRLTNNQFTEHAYIWSKLVSPEYVIQSLTLPTIFLGAAVGIVIFRQWLMREQALKELQQVQLKTELLQLKNQINPHFLFNTLNNINSLVYINPDKASKIIMGLSDVLRYNLYESNFEKVSLEKEIEIQAQILELEKIRRSKFACTITQSGDCSNLYVPPFLFVNFIDNAIKHSADDQVGSFINISFHRQDKTIDFLCNNSVANTQTKKLGGLGLANVKRRLELLYGDNFSLVTSKNENQFNVTLSLPV